MPVHPLFRFAIFYAGLCLAGCSGADGGGDLVDVFPVTGKVTFNGAPVAAATVTFSPKGDQPAAFAKTDAKGVYSLTTYDSGDGAAAGDYVALVTKVVASAPTAAPSGNHAQAYDQQRRTSGAHGAGGGRPGSGTALPDKYANSDQSPLTVTVKDGENTIDLKLEP